MRRNSDLILQQRVSKERNFLIFVLIGLLTLILLLTIGVASSASPPNQGSSVVPGEIIVKYSRPVSLNQNAVEQNSNKSFLKTDTTEPKSVAEKIPAQLNSVLQKHGLIESNSLMAPGPASRELKGALGTEEEKSAQSNKEIFIK